MANKSISIGLLIIFIAPALHSQEGASLADTARQIRAEKNKATTPDQNSANSDSKTSSVAPAATSAGSNPPVASSSQTSATVTSNLDITAAYQRNIKSLFQQEKFETIDEIAAKARSTKERLVPGGFWAIHILYGALLSPPSGSEHASEAEWATHIARLKRWVAQRPESITARVALAAAYKEYAWAGRGVGFANTVTDEGWKLFAERLALAEQTLMEAFKLPEKCPEWYLTMLLVAGDEERDDDVQKAIFDKAIAFEPEYQYYYRARAFRMLPRWGGEPGELAAFAEQSANRIGGAKGDMIYYQIGMFVNCGCADEGDLNGMSWERIKRGYAALRQQYGDSKEGLNKLAFLASRRHDAAYATELFDRIGEEWDPSAWKDKNSFDRTREWEKGEARFNTLKSGLQAAEANLNTPEGRSFDGKVASSFSVMYGRDVTDCFRASGESFLIPFDLILQVGKDGKVEQLFYTVTTNTSVCLGSRVQKGTFPVPPAPSYWVKVSLSQAK